MNALFPIVHDTGWGYMDCRGDVIVSPEHEGCRPFSEGFGAARRAGRYAFFDHKGTRLSDYEFDDARSFSGGFCAVKKGVRWRYIDRTLRAVFVTNFKSCGDFSDGLACGWRSLLFYNYVDT